MRKPSPERDLLAILAGLLVARVSGCEERLAGTYTIQNWLLSTCLPGLVVWPPSFYLHSTHSGRPPPRMQHFIHMSGDRTKCYLPPWANIFFDYEPPRRFVILSFAMYDGSSDPYDHMSHFNQAMILNVENDQLLYKVFPASLKGPALAWFHKLPRGSLNSFDELWATFVSQYLCSVR